MAVAGNIVKIVADVGDPLTCDVIVREAGKHRVVSRLTSDTKHVDDVLSYVAAKTTIGNLRLEFALDVRPPQRRRPVAEPLAAAPSTAQQHFDRLKLFARFWRVASRACRAAAWRVYGAAGAAVVLTKQRLIDALRASYDDVAKVHCCCVVRFRFLLRVFVRLRKSKFCERCENSHFFFWTLEFFDFFLTCEFFHCLTCENCV